MIGSASMSVAKLLAHRSLLDRYPAQISGGQRQRVASRARSRSKADVLLMDEPLSNLDALLRMKMRAELKALLQELGTTTIYVTHDQVEALSMGDRIAVMNAGTDRPARFAARRLRLSGRHLRRRLRRDAADELPGGGHLPERRRARSWT